MNVRELVYKPFLAELEERRIALTPAEFALVERSFDLEAVQKTVDDLLDRKVVDETSIEKDLRRLVGLYARILAREVKEARPLTVPAASRAKAILKKTGPRCDVYPC